MNMPNTIFFWHPDLDAIYQISKVQSYGQLNWLYKHNTLKFFPEQDGINLPYHDEMVFCPWQTSLEDCLSYRLSVVKEKGLTLSEPKILLSQSIPHYSSLFDAIKDLMMCINGSVDFDPQIPYDFLIYRIQNWYPSKPVNFLFHMEQSLYCLAVATTRSYELSLHD